MGKVGQQQRNYKPLFGSHVGSNMKRFVTRPLTAVLNNSTDPFAAMDPFLGTENAVNPPLADTQNSDPVTSSPLMILTPDILDAKLDAKLQLLLQQITCNVSAEVNKLATELREMINYVQAIEEENHNLRFSVSQLQLQQEDLENCERRQNLRFRGIPETVGGP